MAEEAVVIPESQETVKPESTDPQLKPESSRREPTPDKSGEDARYKGLIADLQKERKTRQEFERKVTEYETSLAAERRRVAALAGVAPQNPDEAEAAEIRARFAQYFPDIAELTKEDIDAIRELRSQSREYKQTTEHYWGRHAESMLTALEDEVAESLGGELSKRQTKAVRAAYVLAAQEDPAFLERHEKGDKSLVEQFAKDWIEDWLKPAQRKVTATEIERARRVPSGRDRSVTAPLAKKIDFKDEKAVENAFAEVFKAHGGTFKN